MSEKVFELIITKDSIDEFDEVRYYMTANTSLSASDIMNSLYDFYDNELGTGDQEWKDKVDKSVHNFIEHSKTTGYCPDIKLIDKKEIPDSARIDSATGELPDDTDDIDFDDLEDFDDEDETGEDFDEEDVWDSIEAFALAEDWQ